VTSTSPATLFGGGTWAVIAAGRMLIGQDTGDTQFDVLEETGGAETVTLQTTNLPAHDHVIPDVRSATTGTATTLIARTSDTSSTAGTDVKTATTGSATAFSILPPYIACYMFKRTA
jgi:microcystin-dependent protein